MLGGKVRGAFVLDGMLRDAVAVADGVVVVVASIREVDFRDVRKLEKGLHMSRRGSKGKEEDKYISRV